MQFVDDFFTVFLREKMNTLLLKGFEAYCIDFSIEFSDIHREWHITVSNGMITAIEHTVLRKPTVRFIVAVPVFRDILMKSISPRQAFFLRKTDIKGNLFEGMKLAQILAYFFNQYLFEIDENNQCHLIAKDILPCV
ncbi:SCP2 sterol-binding domain-containing protein [bacterium]|nr:SCP2 sterol-binding domain-containing protein [bacterium]MCP5462264.1 SCP2 sterol-binding domain-containing protein [bacterium]